MHHRAELERHGMAQGLWHPELEQGALAGNVGRIEARAREIAGGDAPLVALAIADDPKLGAEGKLQAREMEVEGAGAGGDELEAPHCHPLLTRPTPEAGLAEPQAFDRNGDAVAVGTALRLLVLEPDFGQVGRWEDESLTHRERFVGLAVAGESMGGERGQDRNGKDGTAHGIPCGGNGVVSLRTSRGACAVASDPARPMGSAP